MRVIVLNQSPPLRQVIDFISGRGVDIEVAAETTRLDDLPALLKEHAPDYLFSLQDTYQQSPKAVEALFAEHPTLAVALFNESGQEVLFRANNMPTRSGVTGHEKQTDEHPGSHERTTVPHSPAEEPRPATEPNAAAATGSIDTGSVDNKSAQSAVNTPPGWYSYALSDFVYLMTEGKPATDPPGGITDVPHDEARVAAHARK
jgi:hypothetical protein